VPAPSDRKLALLLAALAVLWLAMLALGGPGSAVDRALLDAAHIPALVPAARLLTRLADWRVMLPLSFAAAALLIVRQAPRRALLLLTVVLSGRLLVELQKVEFARARPDPHFQLDAVRSMAFPSGHAAYAMMLWLGIALLAVPSGKPRGIAVLAALLLAFSIGSTRLVLAVHWPSDVIGGWAFGAAWTLLLVRLTGGGRPGTLSQVKDADRRAAPRASATGE
jgi:membrane-associated phospholipid phosphatase